MLLFLCPHLQRMEIFLQECLVHGEEDRFYSFSTAKVTGKHLKFLHGPCAEEKRRFTLAFLGLPVSLRF